MHERTKIMAAKKATFGLENEFLVIDEAGQVTNAADAIIKHCKGTRFGKHLVPEVSLCMLEIGAAPKESVRHAAKGYLRTMEFVLDHARKLDLWLYPLATYPGHVVPVLRKKPWYNAQRVLLGEHFDEYAGQICGFHFHKDLPRGVFDKKTGTLKHLARSKAADVFVQQHNFLIAADPALSTLLQSSPFWQGRLFGKDARLGFYRNLEFPERDAEGLYRRHRRFGRLPDYIHTPYDVHSRAESQKHAFLREIREKKPRIIPTIKDGHPYTFYWGPVRVNKLGTFEQRGMDMNLPAHMLGISTLLKKALAGINQLGLKITPSNHAISHPFKVEDSAVLVPPPKLPGRPPHQAGRHPRPERPRGLPVRQTLLRIRQHVFGQTNRLRRPLHPTHDLPTENRFRRRHRHVPRQESRRANLARVRRKNRFGLRRKIPRASPRTPGKIRALGCP